MATSPLLLRQPHKLESLIPVEHESRGRPASFIEGRGGSMNTLWKVAALTVVATSVAGCYTRTREVVREQPIVQQQPVIERQTVVQQPVQQEPRVVERERVVVVQQPTAPAETVPPAPAPTGY